MTARHEFAHYRCCTGFDLMHARFHQHEFAPHSHDEYVISLNITGLERLKHESKQYEVFPGWMTIYNPGEVQSSVCQTDGLWEIRSLYPNIHWLTEIAEELELKFTDIPTFERPIVNDTVLVQQFLKIHQWLDTLEPQSLQVQEELINFLGELLCKYSHPTAKRISSETDAVRQAIDYLSEHATATVSLQTLSQVSGLSRFYLVRAFRKHTGLTPHQFQLDRRMRVAKKLLATHQPLAEIALELGCVDQSHFGRLFKSYTGLSPAQYRKSL